MTSSATAGGELGRRISLEIASRASKSHGNGSSAVLCCDDKENLIPRLYQILKGCIRLGDKPNRRSRR
jgi:hypothetical protein